MTSVIGGVTTTYTYDGDGKRVGKTTGASATVYVYDAAGSLAAEYSTAPAAAPCTTCYLTADTLGSTRMITDGSGNVKSLHDYLPFGEEITSGVAARTSPLYPAGSLSINDGTTQKFTGKERDVETGNDYFGARYLSAAQMRWTIPDWSGGAEAVPYAKLGDPQTLNLYGFVRDDPLSRTDIDGHGCNILQAFAGTCKKGDDDQQQQPPPPGPLDPAGVAPRPEGATLRAARPGEVVAPAAAPAPSGGAPTPTTPLNMGPFDYVTAAASYTSPFGLGAGASITLDAQGQSYVSLFVSGGAPGASVSLVGGNLAPGDTQYPAEDLSDHISGLGRNAGGGTGLIAGVNASPMSGSAPAFSAQVGLGNRQAGVNVGWTFQAPHYTEEQKTLMYLLTQPAP